MKKLVPVYPWPMPPKLAEIVDGMEDVQALEAVPGDPGPILAVRTPPPWVCDAVLILSPEKVTQGVDLVLARGIKLVTAADRLGEMLEVPNRVREIAAERIEKKGPVFK